jgi:hypothetical protein
MPSISATNLKTKEKQRADVVEILMSTHPYKEQAGTYNRYRAVLKFPDGVNGSKILNAAGASALESMGVKVRSVAAKAPKPRKSKKASPKKSAKKAGTPKKLFPSLNFDLSASVAAKKPRAKKPAAASSAAKPKRAVRHTVLNEDQTMRRELLELRKLDRTEYCDTFADIYGDRCVSKYGTSSKRCPSLREKKAAACKSGKKVRLGRAPVVKYGPKNKPAARKPRAKKA